MILGIGIDSVEIARFAEWHHFSQKQLSRLMSQPEIDYCLENPIKSAERFAARFAAREAFYKALSQAFPDHKIPFLTLCRSISVMREERGQPIITIQNLSLFPPEFVDERVTFHLSLTHTQNTASAFLILESKS